MHRTPLSASGQVPASPSLHPSARFPSARLTAPPSLSRAARCSAEFDQSGPLADLLVEEGSTAEISRQLATMPELAGVQVAVPIAGSARPITIA